MTQKGRLVYSTTQWTDDGETYLRCYLRDGNNELHHVDITGYTPRFYVPVEEYEVNKQIVDFNSQVVDVEYEGESVYGDDLVCIYVKDSRNVPEVRETFEKHFEADVPYADRLKLDNDISTGIKVPEFGTEVHYSDVEPVDFDAPDYRVLTLDIETDDRGAFPSHENPDKRILSVSLHDSYTDQYAGFVDLDGRPAEECFPESIEDGEAPGCLDMLDWRSNEREMLIAVSSMIQRIDPDILTAWNSDFDYRYLLARMKDVGVGIGRLSRIRGGRVFACNRWDKPFVEGRTIYDMLEAYKSTKFSELPSYRLDDVAEEELDEKKIQFIGGFFNLYQDDPEKFIEYNARDVRLCVDINREADVLGFKAALQARDGCRFADTMRNGNLVEFAVRRRLAQMGLVGPSSGMVETGRDYTGAVVLDPFYGVTENVCGLDLASLYPNNLAMFNMSPETVVDPMRAQREDIPYVESPSGICFRTDREGIIAGMVDELLDLKSGLKQKLHEMSSDDPEYSATEERYNVTKTIVNSLYGVIGWPAFFMYDPDVAESCTLTGQWCIKRTRDYINETSPANVIYGDTDSCYVEWPESYSAEQAMKAAVDLEYELNEVQYPQWADEWDADNRWEIEAEMFASKYLQTGKKKHYAYLLAGEFGSDGPDLLDKPKEKISGYQCIKSSTAPHARETQRKLIQGVLHDESVSDLMQIIADATQYIRNGPDWDEIGIPQQLKQHIDPDKEGRDGYYAFSRGSPQGAHPRGAWNANKLFNAGLKKGSKPKRIYLDDRRSADGIDVIAFEDASDLGDVRDDLKLNKERMIKSVIINPNKSICDVIDLDLDAAMDGQIQTGLAGFC